MTPSKDSFSLYHCQLLLIQNATRAEQRKGGASSTRSVGKLDICCSITSVVAWGWTGLFGDVTSEKVVVVFTGLLIKLCTTIQ